ncbi:VOC family protein [Rhodoferax sp.]|uniref:VOC family protein n=1 Tax=Rhodoferax sp. TaxID=50421 RepID=UPI00374DEA41
MTDFLAVHSVHEFVFSVPDLEQARHFYTSFGLEVRDEGEGLALYTQDHPHRWARILPGATKRLLWVTYGVYAADIARFEQDLAARNIPRISPCEGAGGVWIKGPDQLPLQIVVAEKSSPSAPVPSVYPPATGAAGRAPNRSAIQKIAPLHLSHILMFSANVLDAVQFYTTVLGLRLSDSSGPVIGFLHSPHGSDHHLIALALSGGCGLHHSSWTVPSLDAVGLGSQQMAQAGYAQGWGLGRHVLGSNYFRYVRDPWGGYAEYSFDIDFIPAGMEWPSADHPIEDSLYTWGPPPPDDFVTNFELTA